MVLEKGFARITLSGARRKKPLSGWQFVICRRPFASLPLASLGMRRAEGLPSGAAERWSCRI